MLPVSVKIPHDPDAKFNPVRVVDPPVLKYGGENGSLRYSATKNKENEINITVQKYQNAFRHSVTLLLHLFMNLYSSVYLVLFVTKKKKLPARCLT